MADRNSRSTTNDTASLLTEAPPNTHFVDPSSDEQKIGEAVAVFAGAGIRKREAVILVTTQVRRSFIENRLRADGHDLAQIANRDNWSREANRQYYLAYARLPNSLLMRSANGFIAVSAPTFSSSFSSSSMVMSF